MNKPQQGVQDAARPRVRLQWLALFALSAVLAAILNALGLPAALLLGPMFAAIALAFHGARLSIPGPAFALAQGIIGSLIAASLPVSISADVWARWPLLIFGVPTVILAAGMLGWILTRVGILPGTTVVWGLSPGAASAMVVLSESFGADARLVALMQYTRVILVTATASAIAAVAGGAIPHQVSSQVWFPPIDWVPFLKTLALIFGGPILARLLKVPAGALLFPMFGGLLLIHVGWLDPELPHWLLAIGYTLIGWQIGLPFTRALVIHAMKKLPGILICTLALMALCAGLAAIFVIFGGLDPLTAYLATSPGGADSVAIIAASSNVDTPFVMAMQMGRFILIVFLGPIVARFVAKRSGVSDSPDNA